MTQDLIYPDKSAEMIVRIKCKICQHQGEAAEFIQLNPAVNTCPNCHETQKLILLLNNRRKIDLEQGKSPLTAQQYLALLLTGTVLFLLYKLIPFPLWSVSSFVTIVVVLLLIKVIKIKPRQK